MGGMKPACFNRPAYTDPNAGWVLVELARLVGIRPATDRMAAYPLCKPVYRYRHPWFTDKCATWSGTGIGPNGERYPEAHGWDCSGCRWLPEGVL